MAITAVIMSRPKSINYEMSIDHRLRARDSFKIVPRLATITSDRLDN